jgi:hypothetical protein
MNKRRPVQRYNRRAGFISLSCLLFSYEIISNSLEFHRWMRRLYFTSDVEFNAASVADDVEEEQTFNRTIQPLNLIPNSQLREHDYFSDSWLLTHENFLQMETHRLGIVEDACFVAIGKGGQVYPTSKMFVDWTDFMVEHMSKWWNELGTLRDPDSSMFEKTISFFRNYLQKVRAIPEKSPLHPTIAMVAFAPYKSHHENRGHVLTVHSLAATIASLYQVGFGRVVVTGYNMGDQVYVEEAFRLLNAIFKDNDTANEDAAYKIGNTELAYVRITNETWVKTQWVKFNMPRAAVIGMQLALTGQLEYPRDWLGTTRESSYWKYVYLTEPDTILHTKPWLLSSIRDGLNRGLSLFPHRLQPLPHESDLPSLANSTSKEKLLSPTNAGRFIPGNVPPFSNVTVLDPSSGQDFCCDDGKTPNHDNCGTWFWTCGFDNGIQQKDLSNEEVLEKHKRLVSYPMMRLERGTGIVFGPTEHGRRCHPSKVPCPRYTDDGN